jgi:hypothetical protein
MTGREGKQREFVDVVATGIRRANCGVNLRNGIDVHEVIGIGAADSEHGRLDIEAMPRPPEDRGAPRLAWL